MVRPRPELVVDVSQVVVVVPCYNEEHRLPVDEFIAFGRRAGARLLFVDDGSTDDTARVLAEIARAAGGEERITVLSLAPNRGKAEAVRAGMLGARDRGADVIAYLDADLATPIAECERLIAELQRTGAHAVLGSRVGLLGWDIDRRAARHYLGRVFATLASLAVGFRVYDTQCGAKVFRWSPALEQAIRTPFRSRWAFDVEILGRLAAQLRITGVPVHAGVLEMPLRHWTEKPGSKLGLVQTLRAVVDLVIIHRELRKPACEHLR